MRTDRLVLVCEFSPPPPYAALLVCKMRNCCGNTYKVHKVYGMDGWLLVVCMVGALEIIYLGGMKLKSAPATTSTSHMDRKVILLLGRIISLRLTRTRTRALLSLSTLPQHNKITQNTKQNIPFIVQEQRIYGLYYIYEDSGFGIRIFANER